MLFTSSSFIILFFPIVIAIGLFLRAKNAQLFYIFIFASSLFLYSTFDESNLYAVLGLVTTSFAISKIVERSSAKRVRHLFVAMGIALNISVLAFYKYSDFFVTKFSHTFGVQLPGLKIELPLAISFLAFQQITYLIDVGNQRLSVKGFFRYAMVVTLFPHLIAGPILRFREIAPQLDRPLWLPGMPMKIATGVSLFAIGIFKKAFIADYFAGFVEPSFDAAAAGVALSFLEAWGATLSYTFQLYFDFSGYSDMAVGLAFCLGIRFPANFLSPYKATSIIAFWRCWHVTLSRFLRDYLYIPLGGGRYGESRKIVNILLTMAIGGVWHGVGWNFLVWGIGHGGAIVINHCWRKLNDLNSGRLTLHSILSWLLTFVTVVMLWAVFRAENLHSAMLMIKGMLGMNGFIAPDTYKGYLGLFGPIFEGWVEFKTVYPGVLSYYYGAIQVVPLVAALIAVLTLPNTYEIMRAGRPMLVEKSARITARIPKYLRWRPHPAIFVVAIGIIYGSIIMINAKSRFLYFQF